MKLSHWVSAANTLNAGIYSPSLLCVWIPCSCLWGTYTLRDRLLKVQVPPCHPKRPRASFPHRRKHFPTDGHSGICTFSWWLVVVFSVCAYMCRGQRTTSSVIPQVVICFFLRQGLYWPFACLADESGWLASPKYPSQHRPGLQAFSTTPGLWGWGSKAQTQVLKISRQEFYQQSHFSIQFPLFLCTTT